MTSLGYRAGHDHIAERPRMVTVPMAMASDLPPPSRLRLPAIPMPYTPKGFLPLLLYSAFGALFPLLLLYVTYDFQDDMVRVAFIVAATLLGLVPVLSSDCCTIYNTVLLFHTGIEVKVIQTALDYAMDDASPDHGMVMAYVGAVTVIVHLLPFYLSDHPLLLSLLATVGVPVNAALALYLDSSMLLLVLLSSYAFLATVRIVVRINEETPSLLAQLRLALETGAWITCAA
jgi:hypothetical protein